MEEIVVKRLAYMLYICLVLGGHKQRTAQRCRRCEDGEFFDVVVRGPSAEFSTLEGAMPPNPPAPFTVPIYGSQQNSGRVPIFPYLYICSLG